MMKHGVKLVFAVEGTPPVLKVDYYECPLIKHAYILIQIFIVLILPVGVNAQVYYFF